MHAGEKAGHGKMGSNVCEIIKRSWGGGMTLRMRLKL